MMPLQSSPLAERLVQVWESRRAEFESSCRSGSAQASAGPPPVDPILHDLIHQFEEAARAELLSIRNAYFQGKPGAQPLDIDVPDHIPAVSTPDNRLDDTPQNTTDLPILIIEGSKDVTTDGEFAALSTPSFEAAEKQATDATRTFTNASERTKAKRPLKLPTIPGYVISGIIGQGGMGVVYKARQTALNRDVALKMILKGDQAGPAAVIRFMTEARAVAGINHPNIVQIHEINEHDGLPYFALEFCTGGSLDRELDKKPIAPGQAAAYTETLARAMFAAHKAGIIHRDIKPSNVLLTGDGTLKVTDFGLARIAEDGEDGLTASGNILGSPSYMSPEQASGRQDLIGPHSDQYSLGATLYEFLTGRPPFIAPSAMETVRQVVDKEPVAPSALVATIPKDLETICLKALSKDIAKRYPDAGALADDLKAFREGRPISARPIGRPEKAWRWAKRNPRVAALSAAAAGLLLTLLVAGGVFTAVYRNKADEALNNFVVAEKRGDDLTVALDQSQKSRREAEASELKAKQNYAFARDTGITMAQVVPGEIRRLTLDPRVRLAVGTIVSRSILDRTPTGNVQGLPDRMLYTGHVLRGDAFSDQNRFDEALTNYRAALDCAKRMVTEEAVEMDKADGLEANVWMWLSVLYRTRAEQPSTPLFQALIDAALSLSTTQQAMHLQRKRVTEPRGAALPLSERRQNLAIALQQSARIAAGADLREALLKEAVELQTQAATAPATEGTRMIAYLSLGNLLKDRADHYKDAGNRALRERDLLAAVEAYRTHFRNLRAAAALPNAETGVEDQPASLALAATLRELGDFYYFSGNREPLAKLYAESLSLSRGLTVTPRLLLQQEELAADYYRAGLMALQEKKPEQARALFSLSYRSASVVLETGRQNLGLLNLTALAAGRCGEIRAAERYLRSADANGNRSAKQRYEAVICRAGLVEGIDFSPELNHLTPEARAGFRVKHITLVMDGLTARRTLTMSVGADAFRDFLRRMETEPDLDPLRATPEFKFFLVQSKWRAAKAGWSPAPKPKAAAPTAVNPQPASAS